MYNKDQICKKIRKIYLDIKESRIDLKARVHEAFLLLGSRFQDSILAIDKTHPAFF